MKYCSPNPIPAHENEYHIKGIKHSGFMLFLVSDFRQFLQQGTLHVFYAASRKQTLPLHDLAVPKGPKNVNSVHEMIFAAPLASILLRQSLASRWSPVWWETGHPREDHTKLSATITPRANLKQAQRCDSR